MTRDTSSPVVAWAVQTLLQEHGLYKGVIDGIWGPQSDLAFERLTASMRYENAKALTIALSEDQQDDMKEFVANWNDPISRAKYDSVGQGANVPAELVAAIHYRECPDFPRFTTYLHNGDPMRNSDGDSIPTTDDPRGYIAVSWTTAAIDAIDRETKAWAVSDIDHDCRDLVTMCVFAEFYNGEGYAERGVPDPYVLAGTSGYKAGKFVSDGKFDPTAVDRECGILALLRAILV